MSFWDNFRTTIILNGVIGVTVNFLISKSLCHITLRVFVCLK